MSDLSNLFELVRVLKEIYGVMRKRIMWLMLLGVVCFSCYDTALDATAIASDSDNQYLLGDDLSGFLLDPFEIIGITPDQKGWDVIVQYDGGCQEHDFYAVWDGQWGGSQPLNAFFELGHVGNNDPCDAVIRDTVRIDFNQLFDNQYPTEGAEITLIQSISRRRITIHPVLARIAQGNFCNINAQLQTTPCGTGIWENEWLKVQDAIDYHSEVWLQPVTNAAGVSLEMPQEGDYDIGVTLLFGYQFQVEGGVCQAQPEGTVIPVRVNCINKD
ncbi:MAG: hypothetical protein RIA69_20645 [Cyclobacteriaceae bacterium]